VVVIRLSSTWPVRSMPGFGVDELALDRVATARAVAEFGDDPTRYANPKARKNYAGTAPITRASGKRQVVVARPGLRVPKTCPGR